MVTHYTQVLPFWPCSIFYICLSSCGLPTCRNTGQRAHTPHIFAYLLSWCQRASPYTSTHTHTHAQTQTRHVSSVLPLRLAATDRNSSLYVKAGQLQHAHTCTHSQQYEHVRLSLILSCVVSHAYAHRSTCIINT